VAHRCTIAPAPIKTDRTKSLLGIGKVAALEAMDPAIFLLPFQQQIKTHSAVQKETSAQYFQMTRWEHYSMLQYRQLKKRS
jgi:hypothetical protein